VLSHARYKIGNKKHLAIKKMKYKKGIISSKDVVKTKKARE